MIVRKVLMLGVALAAFSTTTVRAQEKPAHDVLLAALWTQRSVEYKANALTIFSLARIRLDEALGDRGWTAAPNEQKGDFAALPPAAEQRKAKWDVIEAWVEPK
jgi:acid phosphatase